MAAVVAFIDYRVDFYGLFGNAAHRSLKFYANERTSKYLYGMNYIPANFDGLIIGTSASANWNPKAFKGLRVYNASISGGNISEEKLIADNVFARGRMKLALFCIHPYMTMNHGLKSGYMNPREYLGALGSIQLFSEYASLLMVRARRGREENDENGRTDFTGEMKKVAHFRERTSRDSASAGPRPEAAGRARFGYAVDDTAVAEYRRVLEEARAAGARIVGFVPPLFAGVYEPSKADYDAYFARMAALFRPGEQIIDFNDGRYAAYTRDPKNYLDGAHLTLAAADFFSLQLDSLIDAGAGVKGP